MQTDNNKKYKKYNSDNSFEKITNHPLGNVEHSLEQLWGGNGESGFSEFETLMRPENTERKESNKKSGQEVDRELVVFSAQEREIAREMQVIRVEVSKMVKTVNEVDFAIQKAVMEIPVNPGVYHLNFLNRIRRLIKLIKQKLEDSKTWLKHCVNKKKQKGYWMQYKKKGTSFGLSSERNVATQSG